MTVYTEKNDLDRDVVIDLDRVIWSRMNNLDHDLDNFNPDIRWIAMKL